MLKHQDQEEMCEVIWRGAGTKTMNPRGQEQRPEQQFSDLNGADLGYLGGGVCSQGSAGYVLQLTPGDGRDEVQVVGLMELVPQVLGGNH